MKLFFRNPRLIVTALGIVLIALLGLIGPTIAPFNPTRLDTQAILESSSGQHLLGTDEFGRDILSRLLHGIRPSLVVASAATLLAALAGVTMGVLSGYMRGAIEQLFMRSVDVLLTFPPILLAILIVGFLGPGIANLTVVIGILFAPTFARLAYASTLQVRQMEFVQASITVGASHTRLILKHILPNILSPLIVQMSLSVAASILLESGLSYLGLGIVPPTPSLGLMIADARGFLYMAPMYAVWPSLLIALIVLNINTFGDALRDELDPHLRR